MTQAAIVILELSGKLNVSKLLLSRSLLRRRVNGGHGFGNCCGSLVALAHRFEC